jgi:hypothetical protein
VSTRQHSAVGCRAPRTTAIVAGVCTENLNPHVMVMKSTKDRV